jgi:hypothetical protein
MSLVVILDPYEALLKKGSSVVTTLAPFLDLEDHHVQA